MERIEQFLKDYITIRKLLIDGISQIQFEITHTVEPRDIIEMTEIQWELHSKINQIENDFETNILIHTSNM